MAVQRMQRGAREGADGGSGTEEAGVAGGAAERPRVLVVDFAHQGASAPWIVLGGRDPRPQVAGRRETEWLVGDERRDPPELRREGRPGIDGARCDVRRPGLSTRRYTARILEDEREQHEPEIRVDRLRP